MQIEGSRRQIVLNFATFNSIVSKSSIINEFQFRIFGDYFPQPPKTDIRDPWTYVKPPILPPKVSAFEHIPNLESSLNNPNHTKEATNG